MSRSRTLFSGIAAPAASSTFVTSSSEARSRVVDTRCGRTSGSTACDGRTSSKTGLSISYMPISIFSRPLIAHLAGECRAFSLSHPELRSLARSRSPFRSPAAVSSRMRTFATTTDLSMPFWQDTSTPSPLRKDESSIFASRRRKSSSYDSLLALLTSTKIAYVFRAGMASGSA